MTKTVVLYKSAYGSTKEYAQWIAQEVGCRAFSLSEMNAEDLNGFDTIVFGGGLYAGGIAGISVIRKNWDMLRGKNILVFTVALTPPDASGYYASVVDRNLTDEQKKSIKTFHLRGGLDYSKLSFVHKAIMGMVKKMLRKKKESELTEDEHVMLNSIGETTDFTDKASIAPIVNYVNGCAK